MYHLKMLIRNSRITLERVAGRSPDPDSILSDAGNQRVVDQAAQTLNESNRPAAAKGDHWPISVLNRLTIVVSNHGKGWPIDWCV